MIKRSRLETQQQAIQSALNMFSISDQSESDLFKSSLLAKSIANQFNIGTSDHVKKVKLNKIKLNKDERLKELAMQADAAEMEAQVKIHCMNQINQNRRKLREQKIKEKRDKLQNYDQIDSEKTHEETKESPRN